MKRFGGFDQSFLSFVEIELHMYQKFEQLNEKNFSLRSKFLKN